jgi:hypothetical protein
VVAAYTRGPVAAGRGLPLVRCIQFVVPDRRWRSCDHDHSALIAEVGSQVSWIEEATWLRHVEGRGAKKAPDCAGASRPIGVE